MAASASSSWPTARVSAGGYTRDNGDPAKERPTLAGIAAAWRTPNAAMALHGPMNPEFRRASGQTISLDDQVSSWRTPTASDDGRKATAASNQLMLANQATTWQTPSAQQFEAADLDRLLQRQAEAKVKGKSGNGFGIPLANEVQIWARAHSRCSHPVLATAAGPTSSPERRTLNPLFVEWLMGWPIGWTGSAPVETASCHWWLAMRGELSRLVSRLEPSARGLLL